MVSSFETTFKQAEEVCQKDGAHVVMINTDKEYGLVQDLFKKSGYYWIWVFIISLLSIF